MEKKRPVAVPVDTGRGGGGTAHGPNMRAFGETNQEALVPQRWASNQGVLLTGMEADKDGLALLEEVI